MNPATPSTLIGAACSLRDATRQLLDRLGNEAPPRFLTACEQMALRAQQLCDQVTDLGRLDLNDRNVRHGLRSHLALVIAQCGLWLKLAEQFGVQLFRGDLARVAELARTALERLDTAVNELTEPGATAVLSPCRWPRSAATCWWWTTPPRTANCSRCCCSSRATR
jgi:hypothetical protein